MRTSAGNGPSLEKVELPTVINLPLDGGVILDLDSLLNFWNASIRDFHAVTDNNF